MGLKWNKNSVAFEIDRVAFCHNPPLSPFALHDIIIAILCVKSRTAVAG
jgi:hypothetical protein